MNKQTFFKTQTKTYQHGKTALVKDVASINQRFKKKKKKKKLRSQLFFEKRTSTPKC